MSTSRSPSSGPYYRSLGSGATRSRQPRVDSMVSIERVFRKGAAALALDDTPYPAGVSDPIRLEVPRDRAVRRLRGLAEAIASADDEIAAQRALSRVFSDFVDPPTRAARARSPLGFAEDLPADLPSRRSESRRPAVRRSVPPAMRRRRGGWYDDFRERISFEHPARLAYPQLRGRQVRKYPSRGRLLARRRRARALSTPGRDPLLQRISTRRAANHG